MERKIGETFDFEGKTLQVKESERVCCDGCFFDEKCYSLRQEVAGHCEAVNRGDNKEVIFVEITEEQPQEQTEQPQKLNLCEILKYCPQGEQFWSPMLGDVKLHHVRQEAERVSVILKSGATWDINADGTITVGGDTSPEVMLFPNKWQRDWSKFTAPWLKKERFDQKTLKAFDRVLCKNGLDMWRCDLFSSYVGTYACPNVCIGGSYTYCIPYNDETKHLVGTTDEASDFYRYWEE